MQSIVALKILQCQTNAWMGPRLPERLYIRSKRIIHALFVSRVPYKLSSELVRVVVQVCKS